MSTRATASTNKTITTAGNLFSVKGGVLRVIDSATGDIARTTNGAIENEMYGVYTVFIASTSAMIDNSVTYLGHKTLKISTLDTSGRGRITFGLDPSSSVDYNVSTVKKVGIPVKPSTTYKFSCLAKTNNAYTNSVYLSTRQISDTGVRVASEAISNRISGTNDWTLLTITFTTEATASYMALGFYDNVAGNIGSANFALMSATFEEVLTINNPSVTPALLYPKATAVTSNDNIDQSQVVAGNTKRLGELGDVYQAQQFTPTKKNFTGVTFQRGTDTGTFTGNVTVSLRADSGGSPTGGDLVSLTYTNAQWGALTATTDVSVSLPYTVTPATPYWIVFKSSTADNSNYTRLVVSSTDVGSPFKQGDGTPTWGADQSVALYFKTLYSKNTTNLTISTATQSLSVTSPTTDGWANGTVIDTADPSYGVTPLTLASGANTVNFSSNGPATADGEVDPSLQATFQNVLTQYTSKTRATAVGRATAVNRTDLIISRLST
ncbi:MAG: carbohydrate binding domain-containing protein [Candidatus Paceibacterota bacterium]|jgi:hypothetical protein